jgi:hypothetical protein
MRLPVRITSLLFVVLFALSATGQAQRKAGGSFADVKTVFVDGESFEVVDSSCDKGPCSHHVKHRVEFLAVLKRWLGKSGLAVVDKREDADAVLQGTLSIADPSNEPYHDERGRVVWPDNAGQWANWEVEAWMVGGIGRDLWKYKGKMNYPPIGYSASGPAKVEGKALAKAIQHDLKNAR